MPPLPAAASRKGLNYKGRERVELPSPPAPFTKANTQFTLITPLSAAEEVWQRGRSGLSAGCTDTATSRPSGGDGSAGMDPLRSPAG